MSIRRKLSTAFTISLTIAGIAVAAGLISVQASGSKLLSVQSGSMEPDIPKGSLVQVNRVPSREIAAGDVITYVSSDKTATITHRVTALLDDDPSGNMFVTRGDANTEADTPIEAASVVGRVERSVPYAGFAIDFIKQPLGLLLLIYVPALLIIIHETKRLAAYYRRTKPYLMHGLQGRLIKPAGHRQSALFVSIISSVMLLAISGGFAGTAFALLQPSASLVGNTITLVVPDEPQPPQPPLDTTTCTNTNDVDINSESNQSAQTGEAEVSGNTNGGTATSGNASNSNSTSVDVNISNNCTTQQTQL